PIVNLASRIEKTAEPGEIFFSSSVRDNLAGYKWRKAGIFNLKGIGDTALYKIVHENAPEFAGDASNNDRQAV
ncbi:MAG: hypothetical protein HQK54_06940, partial [Oligoflexales bacterium]|nr:hypothetical protein [Oligoflexales bacterium]